MATLNFFIAHALAENGSAATQTGSGLAGLAFPVLLLLVFFFLFIRPQQKRAKEHRNMVAALEIGDEVVSNGGVVGRVVAVHDSLIQLEVAPDVVLQLQKQAVSALLPKGTFKPAVGQLAKNVSK